MLTIGIATYKDFSGVWMTLEALRMYHPRDVEIVVLDNAPTPSDQTRGVTLACGGRYYHRPDLVGTSAPRDRLFSLARTPWCMVIDSHVMFEPGAIAKTLAKLNELGGPTSNIISGPMIGDGGIVTDTHGKRHHVSTHWQPTHSPGYWGQWAYDEREKSGDPFPIHSQGLGCFLMHRDRWPGFNRLFRGFGGEEGYIHEKVRRLGGQAVCWPWLQWRHRFRGSEDPAPYSPTLDDHAFNILVGHRELAIDAMPQIEQVFLSRLPQSVRGQLTQKADQRQWLGLMNLPRKRINILGVWYSNNSAPDKLLKRSLESIRSAANSSYDNVTISTCSWAKIPDNPFRCSTIYKPTVQGHAAILEQIERAIRNAHENDLSTYDAICYLEHDVLYPADYFDRIAQEFHDKPGANVVSNLDYIGLNGTGWLNVKERHEPMHQLSMRFDYAIQNHKRASEDCKRQGWALLEPQGPRKDWSRIAPQASMPAVHVNHLRRFTSHGEVCYEANSTLGKSHPYWRDYKDYWPEEETIAAPPPVVPVAEMKPVTFPHHQADGCVPCKGSLQIEKPAPAPPPHPTIEAWFEKAKTTPSDCHEHLQTVRDLASHCNSVAELSEWYKPFLIALAAGCQGEIHGIHATGRPDWSGLVQLLGDRFKFAIQNSLKIELPPVDLLLIDTRHTAERLHSELLKHERSVQRYIVVHTTETYGHTGDDGGPGVLWAIREFVARHRQWTVVRQDTHNHGLCVLSRDDRDKQAPPSLLRKSLNFGKALAKHVANGAKTVNEGEYTRRIDLCLVCPNRFHDLCGKCGCPINDKAAWQAEKCPEGKW